MKAFIEAGAAGVHFEDQLVGEEAGHLGGKVLVPTSQFVRTLVSARLAADVLDVPTVLVARTDALSATLLTSDVDERDREFTTGERTPEGFFRIAPGIEAPIARALAYAPYADVLWCETSTPDLEEAAQFAEAVTRRSPEAPRVQLLAVLQLAQAPRRRDDRIVPARAGRDGLQVPFVTLAGFHAVCNSMFEPARGYAADGMSSTCTCSRPSSRTRSSATRPRATSARWAATRRRPRSGHGRGVLDARAQGLDRGSPVRGGARFVSTTADATVSAPDEAGVLTPEALDLVVALEREFRDRREELLRARAARQKQIEGGAAGLPRVDALDPRTRLASGASAGRPSGDRVEITGPAGDRKMVINAFNSGARIYMADFEDANSPTWANVVGGQQNLTDAVERTISLEQGEKSYALNDEVAVLLVRPRGWHLQERHVVVDGEHVSAGLFDFGVYLSRNAERLLARGSGPYFYLPSFLEAISRRGSGTTSSASRRIASGSSARARSCQPGPHRDILAAFEMEEIPLRAPRALGRAQRRPLGLHLLGHQEVPRRPEFVLRTVQVTMTVPFMRAYTELLVHVP